MPTGSAQLAYDLRIACMRLVRRVRYNSSTLAPHFFAVLAKLEKAPTTAADLATRERVSAPSMSRTVGELLERGLISREQDSEDKRRMLLSITEAGQRELETNRRLRDVWMVERLQQCTPDELATLRQAAVIISRISEDE